MGVIGPRRLRDAAIGATIAAGLLVSALVPIAAHAAPAVSSPAPAGAGRLASTLLSQTGPVSTTAADFTPYLSPAIGRQNVRQLVQCGSTMYAVGKFQSIIWQGTTYARDNAFSFSATTGAVTSWNPDVNGEVSSVVLTPSCGTAYLGGTFSSVHGVGVQNLVAVDTDSGAVRTDFGHSANIAVDTLQFTHDEVIAGGQFTVINGSQRLKMASLDRDTGAATSYLDLPFSGTYPRSSPTKVFNSQLSHDGSRLLIEGVFTSVAGQPRKQAAVLDLNGSVVTLDDWMALGLNGPCMPAESFYAQDGAWSPDDSLIFVATTGFHPPGGPKRGPRGGLCDAAAGFPSTSAQVTRLWVNYTGCDSLYSVVADDSSVYVGGHQRWADNANDCDVAGAGSVQRPGIGAIDPSSGMATSWNPTRARGHGADDLLLTDQGLWIASDNGKGGRSQHCAHDNFHGGICFLPYS